MALHAPPQAQCPKCGSQEITPDTRYGNRRKRNDFLRRAFGNPLVWITAVFTFTEILFMTDMPVVLRYPLAVAAIAVILVSITRSYRAVYGISAADRHPDVRYTCRVCGCQWTFGGSRAAPTDEADDTETSPWARNDFSRFNQGQVRVRLGIFGIAVPSAGGHCYGAGIAAVMTAPGSCCRIPASDAQRTRCMSR
jgi:hypothetical protein